MIRIEDLVHKYTVWESDTVKSKKTVLDGISFDIPSGQFLAILGPNGSGKSTLARHLNALLLPDSGTVWIDGKNTADVSRLWQIRSEVGMVFQNPDNQIIGASVEEDVAFAPENRNLPSGEIRRIVEESLEAVSLLDKRRVSPNRLSGGQKQRVAVAGAIATGASCLVLDEPTAMLDPNARRDVLELIHRLNRERGITILLITHHTDETVDADSILLMEQGRVVKQGTPEEIFSEPELLRRVKMDVPQVTDLALRLKARGLPLRTPVLHEEDLVRQLTACLSAASQAPAAEPVSRPAPAGEIVLEARNVCFTYGAGTVNECRALQDVSFALREGECLGLIGVSGSGKTTLVKQLNGLLRAGSGDIRFQGRSIYEKRFDLTSLRKNVGLVFQYPEQQLFGRTVLEDVCYGPRNLGITREEAEASAAASLELVGVDRSCYSMNPLELSGGQKRCVAIAGILAMQPRVLILDEPAAGLDPETRRALFTLLMRIRREKGIAVILVSHHMEDVAEYADQVLVLDWGRPCLSGTPEQVFLSTEALRRIGVGIPQVTSVTERLMQAGLPLPHPAVTVEQAEEMLLALTRRGKEACV